MSWILLLSSGLAGAVCLKLIEYVLLRKKLQTHGDDATQLLLVAHIRELNANLSDLMAIRDKSELGDSRIVKVLNDLIEILGSQVRANETLVRELLWTKDPNKRRALNVTANHSVTPWNENNDSLAFGANGASDTIRQKTRQPAVPAFAAELAGDPVSSMELPADEHYEHYEQYEFDEHHEHHEQTVTEDFGEPPIVATLSKKRKKLQKFSGIQSFAPYRFQGLPTEDQLAPMTCKELGEAGISFFVDSRPDFDMIVVRLVPKDKDPVDLTAHVIGVEQESASRFLLRCKFIGRVYL